MDNLRTHGSEIGPNAVAVAALRCEGPRIYVACLTACQNGILHGRWIAADQEATEIWAEVRAMLGASPIPHAQAYAIHDYEGFGTAEIEENTPLEQVSRLAEFITLRGEALGGAILSRFGGDLDEANAAFVDYAGAFDGFEAFAEEVAAERFGSHPDMVLAPLELAGFGQNLIETGSVFIVQLDDDCHVFWRV